MLDFSHGSEAYRSFALSDGGGFGKNIIFGADMSYLWIFKIRRKMYHLDCREKIFHKF